MSDHLKRAIADLQDEIRRKEDELIGIKQTVNLLCQRAGLPQLFANSELQVSADLSTIQPDTFYGQPLNTSIRRILEMRKTANRGPASVPEIYDALDKGGFQFGSNKRDSNIRGLRITLGKSTRDFHKLPNGSYGLVEWYPEIKSGKIKDNGAPSNGDEDDIEAPEESVPAKK